MTQTRTLAVLLASGARLAAGFSTVRFPGFGF
jgi:hypothetical protein